MSIDLNWETLTSGPDGDALAERIRCFIHDKFQTVPLPRFIRSVNVHGFHFGHVPPELELKDMTDPLPDFYDQELEDDESDDDDFGSDEDAASHLAAERETRHALAHDKRRAHGLRTALRNDLASQNDLGSPFLGTSTPGILGGPGLNYFQSHLGSGGTHTPLAAVAGAHLGNKNTWMGPDMYHHHHRNSSASSNLSMDNLDMAARGRMLREKSSVSTLAPTCVSTSRPPTRDTQATDSAIVEEGEHLSGDEAGSLPQRKEPRVDDVQAVFRIRYAGDVRLHLTAEILLDYPMPSFVGIPLKLNVTGLSFDGVGVLAKIRKRVHFCFLSPEDALAAVGDTDADADGQTSATKGAFGGLLHEIKVESEIGEQDGGKQSLKNVGKVERFVLDQVRRIFDEEFVYPSSWTFLV